MLSAVFASLYLSSLSPRACCLRRVALVCTFLCLNSFRLSSLLIFLTSPFDGHSPFGCIRLSVCLSLAWFHSLPLSFLSHPHSLALTIESVALEQTELGLGAMPQRQHRVLAGAVALLLLLLLVPPSSHALTASPLVLDLPDVQMHVGQPLWVQAPAGVRVDDRVELSLADGRSLPVWLDATGATPSASAPALAGVPHLAAHAGLYFIRVAVVSADGTERGSNVFLLEVLPAHTGGPPACATASLRATVAVPFAQFGPLWRARLARALGERVGGSVPLQALDFAPGLTASSGGGVRGK